MKEIVKLLFRDADCSSLIDEVFKSLYRISFNSQKNCIRKLKTDTYWYAQRKS